MRSPVRVMARAIRGGRIAWSAKERGRSLMPQWKPSLRLLLIVSALLAFAAALGWVDLASFLEW
jgi:hypothetical protein